MMRMVYAQQRNPCLHLQIVAAWLLEVAVLLRRYKDELLSAVLDLLLSAPSTIFPAQARRTCDALVCETILRMKDLAFCFRLPYCVSAGI